MAKRGRMSHGCLNYGGIVQNRMHQQGQKMHSILNYIGWA